MLKHFQKLLQSAMELLQIATVYYKVRWLLQIATVPPPKKNRQ